MVLLVLLPMVKAQLEYSGTHSLLRPCVVCSSHNPYHHELHSQTALACVGTCVLLYLLIATRCLQSKVLMGLSFALVQVPNSGIA